MKLWFVELFEQKVANQLKYVFMDTQRLISESENEIAKWQALIENEKKFISKVSAKAQAIALERARLARKESEERIRDIAKANQAAQKYKN
jgi:hypothetical protein